MADQETVNTTNSPEAQPQGAPDTIYIRSRYASDVMGGVYHLEANERNMIRYVRADLPRATSCYFFTHSAIVPAGPRLERVRPLKSESFFNNKALITREAAPFVLTTA